MELSNAIIAIKDNRTNQTKYAMDLYLFEEYLEPLKARKFGIDKLANDLTNILVKIEQPDQPEPIEQELEDMNANPPNPAAQQSDGVQDSDFEDGDPFEQQEAPAPQRPQAAPMKPKDKVFMPQLPPQLQPARAAARPPLPQPRPAPNRVPVDLPPQPPIPNGAKRKQKQQEVDNNEELDYEGEEKNIFDDDGF